MLQVSPTAEFSCFGPVNLDGAVDGAPPSLGGCGRLRSCSLYAPEGLGAIGPGRSFSRPRSRSFYVLEPEDGGKDGASKSSDVTPSLVEKMDVEKKDVRTRPAPRRATRLNKHHKKDHAGEDLF